MGVTSEAVKLLGETGKLLIECGWVQNTSGSRATGLCLASALDYAYKDTPDWYDDPVFNSHIFRTAEHALEVAVGGAGYIVDWNDTAGRTKDEVLAVIAKAQVYLLEQQQES